MKGFGRGLGMMAGFLLLAVVAVSVGYLYGNYLFQGLFAQEAAGQPEDDTDESVGDADPGDTGDTQDEDTAGNGDEPPPDEGETTTIQLEELRLFVLQVGAFSQLENALQLKQEMEESDLPAFSTTEPPYRVYVLMVDDRGVGEDFLPTLEGIVREEPGLWALPPIGQAEERIAVAIRTDDPVARDHARDMFQALNSHLQAQGSFWSRVFSGETPTPPEFDEPSLFSPDEEGWRGDLARLAEVAQTQNQMLEDARSQDFPEGWEAGSMSLYMKMVYEFRSLVASLRE